MRKRSLVIFMAAVFTLALLACGGGDGDGPAQPAAETPSPTVTVAPVLVPTSPPAAATATTATATPVATEGGFFLQLVEPAETEVFTSTSPLKIAGRTRVDAIVTINDTIVEPNIDGEFSLEVDLEEGPNIIEVVASVASGEQLDMVLVVIYVN